jgi:SAM-dependent methyltransferase
VHFKNAGWEVGGCDLSPRACEQAKAIYGIDIDCDSEEGALPRHKNLNLIYFCHVLEHLRDPVSALMRARDALADDGMLLFEVPCAIAPHMLPPGWFTFEHLQYFSEDAILATLARVGFRPLEIRIALKAELYPVIAVIAVKAPPRPWPLLHTAERTRQFLADFTARDEGLWQSVSDRLDTVSGGIFIWGAGVHTAQLLDRTPLLKQAQIVGIIDRDDQKWGRTQAGRPIISPDEFLNGRGSEKVVISSFNAEGEIALALRKSGIAEQRIVRLYG